MYENNANNLVVAVGFACLSLAAIYVLYGPELYQPILPQPGRRRKKGRVQINGLENTGSNCYVNVIVQALASSHSFIDWLKESLVQQELFQPNLVEAEQQPAIRFIHYLFSIILRNNAVYEPTVGPSSAQSSTQPTGKFRAEKTLTFQLLKLLRGVNGEYGLGVTLHANRLLQILYNFNFESRNEQQDAHELFNFLTSSLENEIVRTLTTTEPSLNKIQTNGHQPNGLPIDQTNEKPADSTSGQSRTGGDRSSDPATSSGEENGDLNRTKEERALNIANEYVPIKRSLKLKRNLPTKGLLAHQMCCLRCEHKFTIQFESFHSISLPLVPRDLRRLNDPVSLQDCLNAFVSREILRDVVCENCDKLDRQSAAASDGTEQTDQSAPKTKSKFVKRLTFAKLPQLLVIHLQRLVCLPSGMPMKKEDRVRFPSILIMDEFEHNNINMLSKLNGSSRSSNGPSSGPSSKPSAPNVSTRSDKLAPSNASDSLESFKDSFVDRQSNGIQPATLLNGSTNGPSCNSSKGSSTGPLNVPSFDPPNCPSNAAESVPTKSDDNHHPDHHASLSNNNEDVSSPIASSNPIKQANDSEAISSNNAKSNDVTDSLSSNGAESGAEGCSSAEPNGTVLNIGLLNSDQLNNDQLNSSASGSTEPNSAQLNGGDQCNGEESILSAPLKAIGSDTNSTDRISSESVHANNSTNNNSPAGHRNEPPADADNCSERPDSSNDSRSNNSTTGDRHKAAISAESETRASEAKASDEYASDELSSNKTSSNSIKLRSDLMRPEEAGKELKQAAKQPKYRYKLNASIVHLGSCFSGHYIGHRSKPADANRSNEQSGDWYFTSDSVVRSSSLEEALQSNGYMLVYERIK